MSRRHSARLRHMQHPDFIGMRTTMTLEEIDCERKGYKLTKTVLGSGAYAKVKLAYVMESKTEKDKRLEDDLNEKGYNMVAIKIVCKKRAPPEYLMKFVPREIDALNATCRHHNVIQLYETFYTEAKIYLVMEYASKGDLLDFINDRSRRGIGIGEELAKSLFRQLVEGIEHCHRRNVVHRDLKCENVLLDQSDVVKISDFGFATRYPTNKCKLLATFCGSYAYAAPEILQAQKYDGKCADVWGLGVILYAMICGRLPFDDKSLHTLITQIKNKLTFPAKSCCSPECQHMIRGLLTADPRRRFTTNQILNHPWFVREISKQTKFTSVLPVKTAGTQALKPPKQENSKTRAEKPGARDNQSADTGNAREETRDFRMPVPKQGWSSASPEPRTIAKFLHKRDPKPPSKSPATEPLRGDTPTVEPHTPGGTTPCPRSFTPSPHTRITNRKELAVKVAQIVAETGHMTRPKDLNRETYVIMCKALQSPQRSGETQSYTQGRKEGVWKYVTNLSSRGRRTVTPAGAVKSPVSTYGQKPSSNIPPVKICFNSPVPHPPPVARPRFNRPMGPWRRGLVISKAQTKPETGKAAGVTPTPESARKDTKEEVTSAKSKTAAPKVGIFSPNPTKASTKNAKITQQRTGKCHPSTQTRKPFVRGTLRREENRKMLKKRVHFSNGFRQH